MPAKTGPIITLTAAAIAAIGSIGPWATLGVFTTNGTEGDGVVTLIAMASVALFAGISLANGPNVSRAVLTVLVGLVATAISLYNLVNIGDAQTDVFDVAVSPSIGWGLWLTFLGSVVTLVGGVIAGSYRDR